ncbi:MAG: hypothetical protein R2688_03540 [Fimbriimonadaceae bacterium]
MGWYIFAGSRLEGEWVNVGISVPDEQMILTLRENRLTRRLV